MKLRRKSCGKRGGKQTPLLWMATDEDWKKNNGPEILDGRKGKGMEKA